MAFSSQLTESQALYTFEIPADPKPETIRFICSSEVEAWDELLKERPTIGALATLARIDPLTPTQVEIAQIFDMLMAQVKTYAVDMEMTQVDREIFDMAMRALMGAGAV
jgi:hypothetical protein